MFPIVRKEDRFSGTNKGDGRMVAQVGSLKETIQNFWKNTSKSNFDVGSSVMIVNTNSIMKDETAEILSTKAREAGVNVVYQTSDKPTGRCAVLITGQDRLVSNIYLGQMHARIFKGGWERFKINWDFFDLFLTPRRPPPLHAHCQLYVLQVPGDKAGRREPLHGLAPGGPRELVGGGGGPGSLLGRLLPYSLSRVHA